MPSPSVIAQYQYKDSISRTVWDNRYYLDTFNRGFWAEGNTGTGLPTGTAADVNFLNTRVNGFEWHVIGTQTILTPVSTNNGLNIVQDATAGDGAEYDLGDNNVMAPQSSFVIGTDPAFFMKCTFKTEDASGTNPLIIGFRKVQNFDATLANYTDFASIGIVGTANPNTIKIQTQVGTGGVVATDTTQTWADGATHTLELFVSSTGVVTYAIDYNPPTVTAAYTFTSGLTVMPFIRFTNAADVTTTVNWTWFEVGTQS